MSDLERDTRAAAFFLSVTDDEWTEPLGPSAEDQADADVAYRRGEDLEDFQGYQRGESDWTHE